MVLETVSGAVPVATVETSVLAVIEPDIIGDVVPTGVADPVVGFPNSVFADMLACVRVTAPVEAELFINIPSPVIELTFADDVLHVGHVIFPVAEVITSGDEAVTAGTPLELPIVHVGVFEFDIVMPFTDDGTIAPAIIVRAGVVPPLDDPENPLAVAMEIAVTVPVVVERVPLVGNVTDVSPVKVPVNVCAPENAVFPPTVIVDDPLLIPVPP